MQLGAPAAVPATLPECAGGVISGCIDGRAAGAGGGGGYPYGTDAGRMGTGDYRGRTTARAKLVPGSVAYIAVAAAPGAAAPAPAFVLAISSD